MSVEIEGVVYRTEKQWEKRHRHVDHRKKGVRRKWNSPSGWTWADFYAEDQTRPWSDKELARESRKRAEKRAAKKLAAQLEAARADGAAEQHLDDLLRCWGMCDQAYSDVGLTSEDICPHTAYQWCALGFVPIADARWRPRTYDFDGNGRSTWYYCPPWDVRWDRVRAEELLETGPQTYDELPDGTPYDGRPWWPI